MHCVRYMALLTVFISERELGDGNSGEKRTARKRRDGKTEELVERRGKDEGVKEGCDEKRIERSWWRHLVESAMGMWDFSHRRH